MIRIILNDLELLQKIIVETTGGEVGILNKDLIISALRRGNTDAELLINFRKSLNLP